MSTPAAVRDRAFMFDRGAECMPRAQLAALQLDRLKKTLQRRELGARHAFGAAIEHECSIADCSWRRHDLTSVGAVSWQNSSRFNHRPGDARAAQVCG